MKKKKPPKHSGIISSLNKRLIPCKRLCGDHSLPLSSASSISPCCRQPALERLDVEWGGHHRDRGGEQMKPRGDCSDHPLALSHRGQKQIWSLKCMHFCFYIDSLEAFSFPSSLWQYGMLKIGLPLRGLSSGWEFMPSPRIWPAFFWCWKPLPRSYFFW